MATTTQRKDWLPSEKFFREMSIGQRLEWLLEYRQLTRTEVAYRIGLTQPAISNIITTSTRKPSAPTLLALSELLQVKPQWLLDGVGDPWLQPQRLTHDQQELLALYNALTDASRQAFLAAGRAMLAGKGYESPRRG